MGALIGALLAVAVGLLATVVGLDRDRAFYPTVTIVVASYFVLFAVMGGSTQALLLEVLAASLFLAAAIAGFRSSLWVVVAALAVHGAQDLFHGSVIPNAGVPPWWPPFCSAFDVAAAAYLAFLLKTGRTRVAA